MSDLKADAPGDSRNARILARASALAYRDEASGAPGFKDELGLDAKLVSANNTQAYVAQDDKDIVVAFRGSQAPTSIDGLKDWLLTNANDFLIIPEGRAGTDFAAAGVGARFHKGFVSGLGDIWGSLFPLVDGAIQQKERPLWVTGHSLGGALALLGAWRFQRQMAPVHQVYTFGAPMVGNADVAAAFEQAFPNKIFRFVDSSDLVPKLPTVSLIANAFAHCPCEVPLTEAAASASNAFDFMKQLGGRVVYGILGNEHVDSMWDYMKSSIMCHLMPNYLAKIDAKAGQSA